MATKNSKQVEIMLKTVNSRKKYLQILADDLSVSWSYIPILMHIRENKGCKQSEISNALGITSAAVTQSVGKMESDDLINREEDEANRRANKLFITNKGREVLKRGSRIFDRVDEVMFSGIDAEDAEKMFSVLYRIDANLNNALQNMGVDDDKLKFSDTV